MKTNTVIDPWTMMIHVNNTCLAELTMMRS